MNERETLARYAAMIGAALPPAGPFVAESEPLGMSVSNASSGPGVVQVERGAILGLCLSAGAVPAGADTYVSPLIELAPLAGQALPDVVDRSGHRRPEYRGLLAYAWLQSFRLIRERAGPGAVAAWESALLAWCRRIEADARLSERSTNGIPAAFGSATASACWAALSLYTAGRAFGDGCRVSRAHNLFATLAAAQQPNGAMLLASRSDNPETHWYHELVILHAMASYAVQASDAAVAAAAARAAEYHVAETQPDHATTQPWGLFAFVSNPRCRTVADEMLHNASIRSAGEGADGISSILLADALYCVRVLA